MAALNYWIKERFNPQNGTSYTKCGQLKVAEAKKKEKTLYGTNTMHRFRTKSEYEKYIKELEDSNIVIRGC